MKFHFSQGSVNKEDKPLTYQESLMLDIQKTKCELENAYAGFDYVTDPDLIDCYIYEQNAVMKRYKYLLQKAASLKASEQAVSGQKWTVRQRFDNSMPSARPVQSSKHKSTAVLSRKAVLFIHVRIQIPMRLKQEDQR